MVGKLKLVMVLALVLGAVGWIGHRYVYVPVSESWKMDAHVDEASKYKNEAETKVTKYAVSLALKHRAYDEYTRGEMNARMQNLDRTRGDSTFFQSPSKERDSEATVLQETIWKIQHAAVRKVEQKTGLSYNFDATKPEWKTAMEAEAVPFKDLFEMDRLLNKLTWNYGRRVLTKAFPNKEHPYTMERFMQDKAEYAELKAQLDALLAKNGLDK
jgi:hypothetical protein